MFQNWMKSESVIESMHQKVQKNQTAVNCQEPIFEEHLVKLFTKAQKARRKITRRWFFCQDQQIYGKIYPERVIKNVGARTEHNRCRFSHSWF